MVKNLTIIFHLDIKYDTLNHTIWWPKMSDKSEQDAMVEQIWRTYLTTGEIEQERRQRRFFRMLPERPAARAAMHRSRAPAAAW